MQYGGISSPWVVENGIEDGAGPEGVGRSISMGLVSIGRKSSKTEHWRIFARPSPSSGT